MFIIDIPSLFLEAMVSLQILTVLYWTATYFPTHHSFLSISKNSLSVIIWLLWLFYLIRKIFGEANFVLYLGNGDSDIFNAIRFAVKLPFRAGVSKTFIVIPCSNCDPKKMTVRVHRWFLFERSVMNKILEGEREKRYS